ncbi:hypothetical protein [Rheinheimera sp.]|uniref:hypothetical protein n=1 Tax=Rheinheimera sp. TaxID=1869214 RepID=UPI002734521F|nr:hypothetical protein [Rheinheimera sp.]MDP2715038.1 hypothetical protein [Rheinheimera sp.]
MDLVQRYIAAVQRELPQTKRDEIGRELNANIMDQLDMLSEQRGELAEADIAAVLKQMGHPRTVAQQFVPPQPLISPGYMSLYKSTLFMVLGILFLLQVVDSTSAWLSSQMSFLLYMKSLASGFMQDVLLGFTSITLAFWLMSRFEPGQSSQCEQSWQPEQLPKAGPHWQHISLQDIFTDLATYVFLLIVIWFPLWLSPEQLANSRFLFTDSAHQILKWASPLALLGIANSLWQLKQRFWSRSMLLSNIVLNAAFVAVILLLVASDPLLKLETEAWQGVLQLEQLERAAVTGLVITAMFPLWEVVRDILRLRKLA